MRSAIGFILLIAAAAGMVFLIRLDHATESKAVSHIEKRFPELEDAAPGITTENYNLLDYAMTVRQVSRLLGAKGRSLGSYVEPRGISWETRAWQKGDMVIIVEFKGGGLSGKRQKGLPGDPRPLSEDKYPYKATPPKISKPPVKPEKAADASPEPGVR